VIDAGLPSPSAAQRQWLEAPSEASKIQEPINLKMMQIEN
jgi:hypothetical protein